MKLVNTDDNVWLEHQMPIDFYDLSHGNLYFMLQSEIQNDNGASLTQMLPGIPLNKLAQEMEGLAKDGDRYYEMAQNAKLKKDYAAMEEYYRIAFSDFNSKNFYTAGLELATFLETKQRTKEALAVIQKLQKNHPAFPETYRLEALIKIQEGKTSP